MRILSNDATRIMSWPTRPQHVEPQERTVILDQDGRNVAAPPPPPPPATQDREEAPAGLPPAWDERTVLRPSTVSRPAREATVAPSQLAGAPVDADPLPRGAILNKRYRVLAVTARGGFSFVYRAMDQFTHRHYVIKEFFPAEAALRRGGAQTFFSGPQENVASLKNAFLREIRVMFELDHPGVAKIHDFFEENGTTYYCAEFNDGEPLSSVVARTGGVSLQSGLALIAQLAETLGYVHERGLIHRDVKPSNVLMTPSKSPMLLDFGSVRELLPYPDSTETQSFTPQYSPPESQEPPYLEGAWTDVYSLFATALFCLVDPTSRGGALTPDMLPRSDALDAAANNRLRAFFEKGLAPNFEDRHQTMAEVTRDISQLMGAVDSGYKGDRAERRKIFVSYAREDEPFALSVFEFLSDKSYEVWIDQRSIKGGASWADQINQGIELCDLFLIVCSGNSVSRVRSSENVMRELTVATDLRKPLMPVFREKIDLSREARFFLTRVQWTTIEGQRLEPILAAVESIF